MKKNLKEKKILVTMALPYANGDIHLGHLLEGIQADIWVRFQRLLGRICYFISGSDAHGTSILLSAQKKNISPEVQIGEVYKSHIDDFRAFLVDFDNFYTTHSEENKVFCEQIYLSLKDRGDIVTKEILQLYDPEKGLFLADRFIKGECPSCGANDQHGDHCDSCGATYAATTLKMPRSILSDAKPIQKHSLHYFFRLGNYSDFLKRWLGERRLSAPVQNKLKEWFKQGLKDWDISRDPPYFGFEIPGSLNRYFYVWLDAPIGYMASFKNLCDRKNIEFSEYWKRGSDTALYHFIGKDIVYFHALFWPAMLHGSGYRTPTGIFTHGFLTINGQKMSKSRGTFVTAKRYASVLNPEFLRYYFAAKLTEQVGDIDFRFDDFMMRVNADLIGKYINLASRCAMFIEKYFKGRLAVGLHDELLFDDFASKSHMIAESYLTLDTNRVIRCIMSLADRANQYIDHHKPWQLIKDSKTFSCVQSICTQGLNFFRLLTLYLKPVLPKTAAAVEVFLNINSLQWSDCKRPLLSHTIQPFKPLMCRVKLEEIEEIMSGLESLQ